MWNARVVVVSKTQLGSVNRLRYREVQPNAGTEAALEDEKAHSSDCFSRVRITRPKTNGKDVTKWEAGLQEDLMDSTARPDQLVCCPRNPHVQGGEPPTRLATPRLWLAPTAARSGP